MLKTTQKPVFIDLFAGAGGLSIGLQQAGFELIAATDWDHWSCETLRANHKDTYICEGDITTIKMDDFKKHLPIKNIDLIVGGPPCQGFSPLGKRLKSDPRNQLWRQFMRFVDYFSPKMFLMENVPELLKSEEYAEIKKQAEKLGYTVKAKVLFAVDHGVPQKRKRAIILGSKIGEPVHPNPSYFPPGQIPLTDKAAPWKTVADAIGNLPPIPDGKNWHVGRHPTELSIQRYKSIPPGGNRFDLPVHLKPDCWKRKKTGSTDVFGRLEWDKPSLTVRTEFYKPEKGRYLHPTENRPITIREAARLQTFPDDYVILGSSVQAAKQVGNAVPVEMARRIGLEIIKLFQSPANRLNKKTVNRLSGSYGFVTDLQP